MSWGQGSRVDVSEDLELICIELAAHLEVMSEGEPWLVGLQDPAFRSKGVINEREQV